jgi:hypothetical protein
MDTMTLRHWCAWYIAARMLQRSTLLVTLHHFVVTNGFQDRNWDVLTLCPWFESDLLWSPHTSQCGDHIEITRILLPQAIMIRIQPNGWMNKKSITTAPWIVIWFSAVNKKTFKMPTISMTSTRFWSKFSEILIARLTTVKACALPFLPFDSAKFGGPSWMSGTHSGVSVELRIRMACREVTALPPLLLW